MSGLHKALLSTTWPSREGEACFPAQTSPFAGREAKNKTKENKKRIIIVSAQKKIFFSPPWSPGFLPVLSGFRVFVGAKQCQFGHPTQSGRSRGRGGPAGHWGNEGRGRTHQTSRSLGQDAVGHVRWWVQVTQARVQPQVMRWWGGPWTVEVLVGEKAGVQLL